MTIGRFRLDTVAHAVEFHSWSRLPRFVGRRAHDDNKVTNMRSTSLSADWLVLLTQYIVMLDNVELKFSSTYKSLFLSHGVLA